MASETDVAGSEEMTPSARLRATNESRASAAPEDVLERFRKYVRRGFVYVPLGAEKLRADVQAAWDQGMAEREERLVSRK